MNHFSTGLWHAMKKWILYSNLWRPAQVGPRRSSKALPKAKLAPKKRVMGHCFVVCCLSDPLQLSESQWNHYIWKVCSANWWDTLKTAMPASWHCSTNGPILLHNCANCMSHNQHFKSWTNWVRSFVSSTIVAWPLANRLPLLQAFWQLFAGKMLPQPDGGRKCFARVHWILKHGFLCYRNELISHWQKCIACNVSYFDE